MTVVSLVLIVAAVVLLGYGLLDGSNMYLVGSILTSLVAALALVVGSRRSGRAAVAAAVEAEEAARGRRRVRQDEMVGAGVGGRGASGDAGRGGVGGGSRGDRLGPASDEYTDHDDLGRGTHDTALLDVADRRGVPSQGSGVDPADRDRAYVDHYPDAAPEDYAAVHDDDDDDLDEQDPEGEPPPQPVAPADAARVAQLGAEVLVIDGRPRYHLPGCVHLLGREHESLPVSEAVELGFSPCSLCEPDSALLANARRV